MMKYRFKNMVRWFAHRTYDRYNVVETGLPPGYYDADTRMLYASFNLLNDYVERQCAWMEVVFDKEAWKKYHCTGRGWHSRAAGLDHLDSIISVPDTEPKPTDYKFMEKSYKENAVWASEAKTLYLWWNDVRPVRLDPWDKKMNDPLAIEDAYTEEDTHMLVRLVKIRTDLWT